MHSQAVKNFLSIAEMCLRCSLKAQTVPIDSFMPRKAYSRKSRAYEKFIFSQIAGLLVKDSPSDYNLIML